MIIPLPAEEIPEEKLIPIPKPIPKVNPDYIDEEWESALRLGVNGDQI
jgi:hypothetical protein